MQVQLFDAGVAATKQIQLKMWKSHFIWQRCDMLLIELYADR